MPDCADDHLERDTYRMTDDSYRTTDDSYWTFSASGESISEVVVRAVATTTGRDPLELDQLYGRVDPDALDDLFTDRSVDGQFVFSFSGCEVVVSPGTVAVRQLDGGEREASE
ncbi:HalOD1 output domain-containing protein [Haloprofundus salilacus]|uniref:HalOD1 output domain-containing protein n=1 Tax=Haloprofundus salilacus TaxID=2876190 RepID=UPI001CCA11B8|nr:HalOD1 output domain-containing protein [Haloprofundus salilacus]